MEKSKGRNSQEGISKKNQATNRHGVKRAGVGEGGEGRRVGHSGQKSCRCIGKDRGIIEMECDNNKWSKIVIEDGEDKMEGVEEVVRTLALSVQFDRVEKK